MSARDEILAAVRRAKLSPIAAPALREVVQQFASPADKVATFTASVKVAGGTVLRGRREELASLIATAHVANGRHVSALGDVDVSAVQVSPHSFSDTDLFVCEAVAGVAENGAVWLTDSALHHRSALFLATAVIIVLDQNAIVSNMHALYEHVNVAADGFGVLVAGPSKTADIEQLLVIGAHGAKALTIILVESLA
jgi:L-lactate dehydrogenase complex protein LldG